VYSILIITFLNLGSISCFLPPFVQGGMAIVEPPSQAIASLESAVSSFSPFFPRERLDLPPGVESLMTAPLLPFTSSFFFFLYLSTK